MTILTPKVYAAFGQSPVGFDADAATWTDISPDVLHESGVSVTRGRGDEAGNVEATQVQFTLKNEDGDYTPGFQGGANWPNVVRQLPLKIDFFGWNYLENPDMESGTGSWSSVAFGWDGATLAQSSTYAQAGTYSLRVTFPASAAGTAGAIQPVFGLVPGQVYTFSAYVRSNTGEPDAQAVCYGVGVGTSMTTKNAFTRVSVTFTAVADFHYVGVQNSSAYSAGKLFYVDSCQLEAGATATAYTTDGNGAHRRAIVFVDDYTVNWPALTRAYSTVDITASGTFRRLAQTSALGSTLNEEIMLLAPRFYYPCTDPTGAGALADVSGNGGKSLPVPWTLGSETDVTLPGMEGESVPNVAAGASSGGSPGVSFATNEASLVFWFRTDAAPFRTDYIAILVGGICEFRVGISDPVSFQDEPDNLYGVSWAGGAGLYDDGAWHMACVTDDTSVTRLYMDGALVATGGGGSSSSLGENLVNYLTLGTHYYDIERLAHVAAFEFELDAAQVLNLYNAAATGFADETIDDRIVRLARYEGETAIPDASLVTVGYQRALDGTALDLMRTTAGSDNGYLYETLNGEISYHPGSARWLLALNDAYMEVDGTSSHIRALQPVFDDQSLKNQAEVSSLAGVGTASNDVSIEAYGARGVDKDTFNASATYNQHHAEWLANTQAEVLDTRPDANPRVPQVTFLLHSNPSLLDAWLAGDPLNQRLTITSPPPQMAGPVELVIEGYTETFTNTEYIVTLNCSPLIPCHVVGTGSLTRVHPAPGAHTLNADITSGATSMAVAWVAPAKAWTTSTSVDLDLNGECVTATFSGSTSPQTASITRAQNGTTAKAHVAGDPIALWSRHVVPL